MIFTLINNVMKQKLFIVLSIVLILVAVSYMAWDLFYSSSENTNPYKFDLESLRKADTMSSPYSEKLFISSAMSEINAVTCDKKGRIYVAGKDSLQVFDLRGKLLQTTRLQGTASCISFSEYGNLLIGMQDHLEIYNTDGKQLGKWSSFGPNTFISSVGAIGKDIFIADAGEKIVYRYTEDGKLINKIGQKDPATSVPGFVIPSPYFDLAPDADGNLWVVNPGLHEFEKFSPEGKLLTRWNKTGMDIKSFCGCCNPSHMAILPGGGFVTSEKAIERVKIYDTGGNFVCVVALPDQFDEGTRGIDLSVGPNGEIIVLDPVRRQIRIFELPAKKS